MLFLVFDLVCNSRVAYLVIFSPVSNSVLMPEALDPLLSSVIDIECMPIQLKLLIPTFVSSDVFP